MATIKDVAKLAGVSHGTVSNVINGSKMVRPDKIKRVEEAMAQLGYRPSGAARSLKTAGKGKNSVALIVPNVLDSAFSQYHTYLDRVFRELGYTLSLFITSGVAEYERRLLLEVQSEKFAGAFLVTCQPDNVEFFERALEGDTKIVFLDRELPLPDIDFVGLDVRSAVGDIVGRLQAEGCRRIALMSGPGYFSCEQQAQSGYEQALGAALRPEYAVQTNLNKESGFLTAFHLMQLPEPPEVILATSSLVAEGVREAMANIDPARRESPKLCTLSGAPWGTTRSADICFFPVDCAGLAAQAAAVMTESFEQGVFHSASSTLLDAGVDLSELDGPVRAVNLAGAAGGGASQTLRLLLLESSAAFATRSLLPLFCKEEGVEVVIETLRYDDMYDSIQREHVRGETDLFCVDIPWVPELADGGIIEDISARFQEDAAMEGAFSRSLLRDFAQFDGRTFAVPYFYCAQMLFYRRDLFESLKMRSLFFDKYRSELKPPRTWPEFNAVAEFFTRASNPDSPTRFGATLGSRDSSGAVCEYLPRLWAYHGSICDSEGNFTLDTREAVRALESYCSCFAYAAEGSTENWWDEQVQQFSEGQAAMMMTFGSHATQIMDCRRSNVAGKVGFDMIPGAQPLLGGWSLAISTRSARKDLAWRFLQWMASEKLGLYTTVLGGCVPTKQLGKVSELQSMYPWFSEHLSMYRNCHSRTAGMVRGDGSVISEYRFEKILGSAVHAATTGRLTPQAALEQAQEQLNALSPLRI